MDKKKSREKTNGKGSMMTSSTKSMSKFLASLINDYSHMITDGETRLWSKRKL